MNGQPLTVAASPVAGEAGQTMRCGPLAYAGGDALPQRIGPAYRCKAALIQSVIDA